MAIPWLKRCLVVAFALGLDLLFGDPPNRFHPVAWMGNGIAVGQHYAPKQGNGAQFVYGLLLSSSGVTVVATVGWLLVLACRRVPWWLAVIIEAVICKVTVALRGLSHAAEAVYQPLAADDLPTARQQLHWHLVSRDTATLTEGQIAAATIESVAENASDGVIAPLLYYVLFGVRGALVYRFLNTADAMLGYRDVQREWLGKAAARLDDAANLLPARLTALLILGAGWLTGDNGENAWRVWRRDARSTASPNAGHPMSAMAGALGVALEKVDHYTLGAGQRPPTAQDIRYSVTLLRWATWLGLGVLLLISFLFGKEPHDHTHTT